MNEKVYIGNAIKREGKYGEFYTGGIRLKDLEKYDNGKGWINFMMSGLKTPGKFGESHSIIINDWKPNKEVDTSKAKPMDNYDINEMPF